MTLTERVLKTDDIDYKKVKELMKKLFPKEELAPMWVLMLLGRCRPCNFSVFYCEDLFVGLVYTIELKGILHIKYLAVDDEIHSVGYGSEIVNIIKERYKDKTVTLFIEIPNSDFTNYNQRVRRLKFYEKNGFYPSKINLVDKVPLYELLSTDPDFSLKDCKNILRFFPMKVVVAD